MKKGYLFILLAGAVLYTSAKAETTQATVYRLTPEGTGAVIGTITFTDTAQGLRVDEKLKGLEPGEHGIHIHENGNCGSTVVDGKTVLGNLRVTRMQNGERNRTMIFYELTWSDITAAEKELLQYDVSGEYTHKRAAFNNMMKKFLNDTGPDPMIYLMDKDNLILNATKQATCWMLGFNYDELKPEQKKVCLVESYQQIKDMSKENIVFITHSLGSRILVDSFTDIVEQVYAQSRTTRPEAQKIINELKNQELTVYVLANQLPMLQIGRKKPKINNRIPEYCSPKGKHYQDRVFKKVNIVAFSDPNDILSYDVPQRFVDTYFDSRMCPAVTNVNLNVAEEISAFGMSVVNPVTAHTEYDNDVRIIEMIAQGTNDFKSNPLLSKICKMTLLQD